MFAQGILSAWFSRFYSRQESQVGRSEASRVERESALDHRLCVATCAGSGRLKVYKALSIRYEWSLLLLLLLFSFPFFFAYKIFEEQFAI